jgi:hypothetical protein
LLRKLLRVLPDMTSVLDNPDAGANENARVSHVRSGM